MREAQKVDYALRHMRPVSRCTMLHSHIRDDSNKARVMKTVLSVAKEVSRTLPAPAGPMTITPNLLIVTTG